MKIAKPDSTRYDRRMNSGRARVLQTIAGVLALAAAFIVPACLDGGSVESSDLGLVRDGSQIADAAHRTFDLSNVDSAQAPASVDMSKPVLDLTQGDLTGLFNCYNVAICAPNQMFCIKYFDGSAAAPGKLVGGSPACYEPSDTCGNQGQNMDCGCIQNDGTLGPACQGSCVDNQDGTFTCYAQ